MDHTQEEMLQPTMPLTNEESKRRKSTERGSDSEKTRKKKKMPKPKLKISIGTLVEIEKWAERARIGETKYAFRPVVQQMRQSGDHLDDVIHSVTLAQIMPYKEMKNYLQICYLSQVTDLWDCVDSLSHKYQTSQQNVTERLYHVGRLSKFLKEQKKNEERSSAI